MSPRHRYRKPRFRGFKPAWSAKAPRLMLALGLLLSVAVHLGLAYTLKDQTFGQYDPAALSDDDLPVRIKRAKFDQIVRPAGQDAAGQDPGDSPPDADQLAEAMMQEVETQTPEPLVPELELRSVPEPTRSPEPPSAPPSTADLGLDELLGTFIDEPAQPQLVEAEQFDVAGGTPDGGALGADLLDQLAVADGGLPAGGGTGIGAGPGPRGLATGGGADAGYGPGRTTRGGQGTTTTGGGVGEGGMGGAGLDFLGIADIEPADFEPPERLDNDFDYRVTRFEVPGAGEDWPGYFRVQVTGKRSLRKLETMPKDVVFMVDTSRSIRDRTIQQIVEGIKQSIRTLNDQDRFNLVFFNDQVSFLADEPVPATFDQLEYADRWMRNIRARGQTDVNLALRQLLRRDIEPGRIYELILISDGRPTLGVLDTRELINLITRENDLAASIYCVGIGRGQDNRLLDFLAYRNKGFSISIDSRGDIALELVGLMSRLRYPIIQDIQVRFAGQGMDQIYPLTLPNVHQGESFAIYGRYDRPGPFTVQITGRSAGKPTDLTFRADLADAVVGETDVATGWAFWKLHHLYSEIIRLGEREDLLQEIRTLRERYRLETLY